MGRRIVFGLGLSCLVWFAVLMVAPSIRAEDEQPTYVDGLPALKRPLPPRYGPRLAPPLTYI